MIDLNDVTIIIINYKTYNLTKQCVESCLKYYPQVKLVLIDNGSVDNSTAFIKQIANQHNLIVPIFNQKNIYHGPAMNKGIKIATTQYIFTLDSDCQLLKNGFLEKMLDLFNNPALYAVGKLVYLNRYGYRVENNLEKRIKYIHPYAMLLDKNKYLGLNKFIHHGSPCIKNMKHALKMGYELKHFKLDEFVLHHGRGTCSKYGYAFGVKQKVEYFLNKYGIFA